MDALNCSLPPHASVVILRPAYASNRRQKEVGMFNDLIRYGELYNTAKGLTEPPQDVVALGEEISQQKIYISLGLYQRLHQSLHDSSQQADRPISMRTDVVDLCFSDSPL